MDNAASHPIILCNSCQNLLVSRLSRSEMIDVGRGRAAEKKMLSKKKSGGRRRQLWRQWCGGQKVREFGELVDKDCDGVESADCRRKRADKIHSDHLATLMGHWKTL